MNLVETSVSIIKVPAILNPATISDLERQWSQIDMEQSRIVLLVGSGEHFCLGMDINWIAGHLDESFLAAAKMFGGFLNKLQSAPCITLAVVDGTVAGGGVGICAACNIAVASTNSSFRLTEGLLGLTPGIILPALLSRLSRQVLAKMVFSSKKYTAPAALEIGLIDACVPAAQLEAAVHAWIRELKNCKRQTVLDLKELLANTGDSPTTLLEKGTALLMTRLSDKEIQDRLANLAYFDNV